MRHRLSGRHLGRTAAHRKALIRNQVTDLLRHDRIVTTEAKAKEVRPIAERVITMGKRGDSRARRRVGAVLTDKSVLRRLFDEVAPRFRDRPGGYTRIVKLGPRLGDGAHMAQLEIVEGAAVPAVMEAPTSAPAAPDPAAPVTEDIASAEPAQGRDAAGDTAPDADASRAANAETAASDEKEEGA